MIFREAKIADIPQIHGKNEIKFEMTYDDWNNKQHEI